MALSTFFPCFFWVVHTFSCPQVSTSAFSSAIYCLAFIVCIHIMLIAFPIFFFSSFHNSHSLSDNLNFIL
jgi:hypothetical protein